MGLVAYNRGFLLPSPAVVEGGGDLTQDTPFTINTTAFASKAAAAPVIYDNCSHGQALTARWDGAWPNVGTANYQTKYETPASLGRGVSLPHSNGITAYMRGCHGDDTGFNQGWNVMPWKTFNKSEGGWCYLAWYARNDPAYTFSMTNHKWFDYSTGTEPYNGNDNWYIEYRDPPSSLSGSAAAHVNDDDSGTWNGTGFQDGPDDFFPYWWSARNTAATPSPNRTVSGANTEWNKWVKREVLIKISNSTNLNGRVLVFQDNVCLLNGDPTSQPNFVAKYTDDWTGTGRVIAPGGYQTGGLDSSAWRYFADLVWDTSVARVVLTNNATYESATIVEYQPATDKTSTTVTCTCKKGALSSGTVHVFAFDSANTSEYIGSRTIT